jgi:predicted ATPase/Tfp pilus assembly protein PilF
MTRTPAAEKPTIRLPIPATPFIERPVELQQIAERLDNPACRLLSIVGPGGIGKTRLALKAAAEYAHAYRDGVYFVSLVSVQSDSFLPVEIAGVLHFTLQGIAHPRDELIGYLTNREMLLVLDNFEHLIKSADLIIDILNRAPGVRILVTSREWLNIQHEWVLPIGGMAYPAEASADAARYSAVQLFVSCAQRVRPRFSLDEELDSVVKICQLVEGMPLSIELAAAWLRVISASEIAQQMSLKFLTSTVRDIPERHRSVQTIFDYSWNLLSGDEARALTKLSVFKGPFDRAAASQVAGATVLVLASLIEKSLIRLVNENYYDIHELLRQYAFNQLAEAGEVTATQSAHLDYYVALTADLDSQIHGRQQTKWLDRLEQEHDNLRTALDWALEQETQAAREAGLALGASLWEFWLMRGHIGEGRQWLERLLGATEGAVSLARGAATQGAGYLAWIQGESDHAEALHQEGLAIRRALDDEAGMGGSLSNLGVVAWSRGDFEAADMYYDQALTARRNVNDQLGAASVLTNLSLLRHDQNADTEAVACAEEAGAIFQALDDLQGIVHSQSNLGAMAYDRGDWEGARSIQEKALNLARQLGDQRVIGVLLENLGQTLIESGEYALAHNALEDSLNLVSQVGDRSHVGLVKKNLALLALREGRLEDAQALIDESLAILRAMKAEVFLEQAHIIWEAIQRVCANEQSAPGFYRESLLTCSK